MTGILIVDKPAGWTSHDVVAKLRGILKERRIGHAGTLDPMATGVLPVFVGRATRAVEFMENADKEYVAALRPGIITDTQDTTGNIISRKDVNLKAGDIEAVLGKFRGDTEQLPPMYSAVKIGGRKLYEYARRGVEVERKARKVSISELELTGEKNGDFILRVVCSKGTYIRSLCADIGERLGCGAAMSSLVRTRAGAYKIDSAHSMEEIISLGKDSEKLMLSLDSMFEAYPSVSVGEKGEKLCKNGVMPRIDGLPEGKFRLYGKRGEFLALCQSGEAGARIIKSFYEV